MTPRARCPVCYGLEPHHGTVHRRHPAGGGGSNLPCPNGPAPVDDAPEGDS